ncbi:MAG: alpha/beta hydrolase, partial [Candidatus Eremiobacteraeota bacterium]|nr:alpha/beta hydrolase [Candidatus Eremiobacteraeota bacterium]
YRAASPLAHVRPGLPPPLLIYGGRDHLVEARFGRALDRALIAAGDPVAYVELPWAEHGFDAVPGGVGERVATAVTEQFLRRVTIP